MFEDKRREAHDVKRNQENRQRARSRSFFERSDKTENYTESLVYKSRKIRNAEQRKIFAGFKNRRYHLFLSK